MIASISKQGSFKLIQDDHNLHLPLQMKHELRERYYNILCWTYRQAFLNSVEGMACPTGDT